MISTLGDYLENTTIVNNTCNGQCSNCGECCGDFLPLSQEDIHRIHSYIKSHNIKEHKNNVVQAGFDFTCPFRDNVKRICSIYKVRPEICREFQCDQSPETIQQNKALLHTRHKAVSMRREFFGSQGNTDMLLALYGAIAGRTIPKENGAKKNP